jgi:VanZ family protein
MQLIRRVCLLLVLATASCLFYLGSKPFAVNLIPSPWDKLAHFLVFSSMTAMLWIAVQGRMPIAIVLLVVGIGAGDELYEMMLPGRSADAYDFLADFLACTITGTALYLLAARRRIQSRGVPRRADPG